MSLKETLAELERCGTEQNRKVYARHGVGRATYGASFKDLRNLAKRIKKDQALARHLWATGNHDARNLATMVADPASCTAEELDAWAGEADNYVITDAVADLASRTPVAQELMERWIASLEEWRGQAGWAILAKLAMTAPSLSEELLATHLKVIEKRIHSAPNRTRHAMNMALAAIGGRSERLRDLALAAAARIGKVHVDHGATGCKTPDATDYIARIWARKARKQRSSTPATTAPSPPEDAPKAECS